MRILGKKRKVRNISHHPYFIIGRDGGDGVGIGSGVRRIRPIHISHWLRRELLSTVMEDENTSREQGRGLYDIL